MLRPTESCRLACCGCGGVVGVEEVSEVEEVEVEEVERWRWSWGLVQVWVGRSVGEAVGGGASLRRHRLRLPRRGGGAVHEVAGALGLLARAHAVLQGKRPLAKGKQRAGK